MKTKSTNLHDDTYELACILRPRDLLCIKARAARGVYALPMNDAMTTPWREFQPWNIASPLPRLGKSPVTQRRWPRSIQAGLLMDDDFLCSVNWDCDEHLKFCFLCRAWKHDARGFTGQEGKLRSKNFATIRALRGRTSMHHSVVAGGMIGSFQATNRSCGVQPQGSSLRPIVVSLSSSFRQSINSQFETSDCT